MYVAHYLDPIDNRYDPEHDIISGGPRVTWAEYNLMVVIREQQKQIETLQKQMELIHAMFPSVAQ